MHSRKFCIFNKWRTQFGREVRKVIRAKERAVSADIVFTGEPLCPCLLVFLFPHLLARVTSPLLVHHDHHPPPSFSLFSHSHTVAPTSDEAPARQQHA